ncbi:MAG TPA: 6,7-dimethyl-8-ribityllumazine synthase [Proteobacteria bacterium]|nr:6,7-dimethyl-8-ribityllumazine synthase [bacterium BMS3Abin14]HDL52828.1 6,7-dimethyl-8-ribityllumazine synthase [Pseudomonadota bacterium]
MGGYRTIQGKLDANGLKVAVIASRFNDFITDRLINGAIDCLLRHGAGEDDITVYRVPGSFEIPVIARRVVETADVDAVVCVGAVIRGQTPHFDFIAAEVTKGIAQVSMASGVPVTFGVITADSLEQAVDRAGAKAGNKGYEAAAGAIEMANLLRQF